MSVYFITAREVGKVKIGCANDPWERLLRLQTSSPTSLRLEVVFPGHYKEEREYHIRFAEHRVNGEWFNLAPEIEALITSSPAPVRPYQGSSASPKRKLERLLADNAAIDSRAIQRERAIEAVAEAQIARERAMSAEAMRDFAALDLDPPRRAAA